MEHRSKNRSIIKDGLRTVLRSIGIEDPIRRAYWRTRLCRSTIGVELGGVRCEFRSVNQQIRGRLLRFQNERAQLCELIENLRDGDVFWDVGANVGLFSLFACRMVGASGRVFAFEPEKHARRVLLRNCRLNRTDKIMVMDVALGDHAGEVDLFVAPSDSDFVGNLVPSTKHSKCERIRMETGDGLVVEGRAPVPNAVKIDVEGAEYHTLVGMRETLAHPSCRFVLLELHASGMGGATEPPMDCERFLDDAGFAVRKKWERGQERHWAAYKQSAIS